jgi:hypothetical protein
MLRTIFAYLYNRLITPVSAISKLFIVQSVRRLTAANVTTFCFCFRVSTLGNRRRGTRRGWWRRRWHPLHRLQQGVPRHRPVSTSTTRNFLSDFRSTWHCRITRKQVYRVSHEISVNFSSVSTALFWVKSEPLRPSYAGYANVVKSERRTCLKKMDWHINIAIFVLVHLFRPTTNMRKIRKCQAWPPYRRRSTWCHHRNKARRYGLTEIRLCLKKA